jgi:hypothetical protein
MKSFAWLICALALAGSGCNRADSPALVQSPAPVQAPVQPTLQPQPVAAKDLHGLQLAQTWTPETYVYLVESPERLGSEVDATRGRVDFLTYKLCLLSAPTEAPNQAKCDKLVDRVEAEENKLPKW